MSLERSDSKEEDGIDSLSFDNMEITPKIVADLVKLLRSERRWQRVELSECSSPVTVAMVLSVAMMLDNVRGFMLRCSDLTPQLFVALGTALQTNSPTSFLGLDAPLTGESVHAIARGLAGNSSLTTLDLSGSTFDDEALKFLVAGLRKNKHIRSIKFVGCGLSDEELDLIVSQGLSISRALRELQIDQNCCRSKGMNAISKLLQSGTSKLSKLRMSHQNVTAKDTFDILPLATALHTNSTVTQLDLSSNSPIQGEKRVLDVIQLAEALQSNKTLTSLNLAANNMSDSDLAKLVTSLSGNSTISTLDLQNNLFKNDGISQFVKDVGGMKGLRKIYLGGNMFSRTGIETLLTSLPKKIELLP